MSKLRKYISEGRYEEVNAIEIPEGATNGDVIKAMFPQIKTKPSVNDSLLKVYCLDSDNYEDFELFYEDWWNAPFKVESEDKR